MVWLRLGLGEVDLANRFQISQSTVSRLTHHLAQFDGPQVPSAPSVVVTEKSGPVDAALLPSVVPVYKSYS